jgi:hypothetical protein
MSTEAIRYDLTIRQGATWSKSLQWMQSRKTYKPITAVPLTVPVRLTVTAHSMPDGWPCLVTGVDGMTEINTVDPTKPHIGVRVDANTVELENVNGEDFAAYVSGGHLEYYTPYDLSEYTSGQAIIRASQGSASVLDTLSYGAGGVTFDNTLKLISLARTAVQTTGYTWSEGWYDLDLTHSTGRIDRVSYGRVALMKL